MKKYAALFTFIICVVIVSIIAFWPSDVSEEKSTEYIKDKSPVVTQEPTEATLEDRVIKTVVSSENGKTSYAKKRIELKDSAKSISVAFDVEAKDSSYNVSNIVALGLETVKTYTDTLISKIVITEKESLFENPWFYAFFLVTTTLILTLLRW